MQDNIRDTNGLRSYNLRDFTELVFKTCPELRKHLVSSAKGGTSLPPDQHATGSRQGGTAAAAAAMAAGQGATSAAASAASATAAVVQLVGRSGCFKDSW